METQQASDQGEVGVGRGAATGELVRQIALAVLSASIAAGFVAVMVAGVWKTPLGYDGGYNLQVPAHLATTHSYATNGSLYGTGPREFDTLITTGPTLLAPIGALFAAFGQHLWLATLVATLGYLALALGTWRLGSRVAGRTGALAALLALLAVNTGATWPAPGTVLGTGDVIGEFTATTFLVMAALSLPRHVRRAGFLLGLALLTKALTFLAVPAFVLALLVAHRGRGLRTGATESALMVGWVFVPLSAWTGVRFLSLGADAFLERATEFLHFFIGYTPDQAGDRLERALGGAETLSRYLPLPALVGGLLMLAVVLAGTRRRRPRSWLAKATSSELAATVALGATSLVMLAWWLFSTDTKTPRHALMGVLLALITLAPWTALRTGSLLTRWRGVKHRIGTAAVALAVLGLLAGGVVHVVSAFDPPGVSLSEQRRAADVLRVHPDDVVHTEWWQNPDLAFLSGTASRPLDQRGGLLVLSESEHHLQPDAYARALTYCGPVVYHRDGYLMCWVAPGTYRAEPTQ